MARPSFVLRMRTCRWSACSALFWICRSCDRGQGYCSEDCRSAQRRRQRRAANRRHQRSPEGRADHRDRQRAYRERLRRVRVTDQGRRVDRCRVTVAPTRSALSMPRGWPAARREDRHGQPHRPRAPRRQPCCVRCGRPGRFIDPFQGR